MYPRSVRPAFSATRKHAACIAILACISFAPVRQAVAQARLTVEELGWMQGCWQRATATTTIEEQWMAPRGGMLVGMGRTTKNGRVQEYEFLRIFSVHDTLVYGSIPSGQTYAEFRARSSGPMQVTFENLAHDFPQRIGYRAAGPDSLYAFIEGQLNGVSRRVDFPYARAACPVAPAAGGH